MTEQSRSLKNIFITPRFQLKLMSYFVGLFILTTICLYSTTYLFFRNLRLKGLEVGIPEGHIFYQFLRNLKTDLDLLFVALAALNLVLLLGVGFLLSHRIAGPLHKLKNYLSTLSSHSEAFRTREDDFLQDMNEVVNTLKDKVK